ncbi:MAG: sigma-70 family RNA polymerase sigma factor [Labilithrix sp.]|nr:sigma-70 family RNA polymerase sigma factor [Labilithrix sp.]MCW5810947.1 sigma-70 family RNA polymerase sigma factor [Labilithrix sp.]
MEQTALTSTNDGFASHMHLVLGIVADFMRRVPRSVQREDLVAAGSVGLLHALRSKKHTCPEMLAAYARIRIRGAIIDELRRHDWSPRRRRTPGATTPSPVITNGAPAPAEKPEGVVVIGFDDLPPTHAIREEGPSPLEQVETSRENGDLRRAVDKLPPRERSIVCMRYFEDQSSKSIATMMGLSEARVSQLLARATAQLKELLLADQDMLPQAA